MAHHCANLGLLNKLETLTVMIPSALSLPFKLLRSLTVCTFGIALAPVDFCDWVSSEAMLSMLKPFGSSSLAVWNGI